MQLRSAFLIVIGAAVLGSCDEPAKVADGNYGAIADTPDPLVARALNDPIMIDPDLAHRNEANAALTIRHDHALPPHISTSENAEAAREAARRELLLERSVSELPAPSPPADGDALALGMTAKEIITTSGAPSRCIGQIQEGLVWAARMPDSALVMPHGMTMQAAGADTGSCNIRIVRYVTPVSIDDALRYHFNRASRAGMTAKLHREPEAILDAARGSQHLKVYARPGASGTSAIDLIYWQR